MSSEKAMKFMKLSASIAGFVKDGWENVLTGLGVKGKDKRLGSNVAYRALEEKQLENLHDGDDIAHRVVNLIPEEGTRDWIEFKSDDKTLIENMITITEDLDMQAKVEKAWAYSRQYRGAGIFISVDDGLELNEPINPNRLVRIKSLTVLSSFELQSQGIVTDINDPQFGLPEFYNISPRAGESVELHVHHSRVVRFEGAKVSQNTFIANDYWGDSVLTKLENVLRNFNLSHDSVAAIMQDFNTGILRLQNLAELIEADEDDAVTARLRLMNLSKSILGTVLLDADSETYENKTVPLTNVDKVLDKVNERLVAATNMPHNKILGMGPKTSLGGGGDSEEKDWLTNVANLQVLNVKKPINKILKLIQLSKQGPTNGKIPVDFKWLFKPLWVPSQKELQETKKLQAETDEIYWKIGALSAIDIAKSAFTGDEFSFERQVDLAAIKAQEKAALVEPDRAKQIIETGDDFNLDNIEMDPDNPDDHWHLDALGGNTGPLIDMGLDKQGRKIHSHKRANNKNLTDFGLTGVPHTHFTIDGETGESVTEKGNQDD